MNQFSENRNSSKIPNGNDKRKIGNPDKLNSIENPKQTLWLWFPQKTSRLEDSVQNTK